MHVLAVRNAQEALPTGLQFLFSGERYISRSDSRNGEVLKCLEPVTTRYDRPRERVLFHPERNANPFFHFMEGLWMLGGRRDVKWISQFNKTFGQFSDDKENFHAAYGHRWRNHFGMDQIFKIVDILTKNPLDRRAVMTMWDPKVDLGMEGLDFPCNTQIYFDATHGYLNMTVTCRSNDIVWGAYGANAVHMSMMQEVVASMIGIPVGQYWQISNNWHGYTKTAGPLRGMAHDNRYYDPYKSGDVEPYPMMGLRDYKVWFQDLEIFLKQGPIIGFRDPFFRQVVTPIYHSWMAKSDESEPLRFERALEIVFQCQAEDWRKACMEWLERAQRRAAV